MEKVIFPLVGEIKEELDRIRYAIQSNQNGTASRSMGQGSYAKNYGVSLARLREIARDFEPGEKLSECLWQINYRETKILSILLRPLETLGQERAVRLMEEAREMELCEVACRTLLSKAANAADIAECLASDNGKGMTRHAAYLLTANLLASDKARAEDSICQKLLEGAEMLVRRSQEACQRNQDGEECEADLADQGLAAALSRFLGQLSLYKGKRGEVMGLVERMASTENMLLKWAAEEVRTVVLYSNTIK